MIRKIPSTAAPTIIPNDVAIVRAPLLFPIERRRERNHNDRRRARATYDKHGHFPRLPLFPVQEVRHSETESREKQCADEQDIRPQRHGQITFRQRFQPVQDTKAPHALRLQTVLRVLTVLSILVQLG